MSTEWQPIAASECAKRSVNPLRRIVESLVKPDLPEKPFIPLSLGDPTVFGNLPPSSVLVNAVKDAMLSEKHNGYIHSAGAVEARKAVAAYCSVPGSELTEHDVIIASGCSGAIDLVVTALFNPGDNLLIPQPAFPLYQTLAVSKGVQVQEYRLLPERQWEADLTHMESLINSRTRAILVNNPSNPCGSVYPAEHLKAILAVAEKHHLPVIADEIYGPLVFEGNTFTPMASLTTTVPVIAVGGIAKIFLVPGWRVGWIALHDRNGLLRQVRDGLFSMTQMILGSCTLIQAALPAVLTPDTSSESGKALTAFHADTLQVLQDNAHFTAMRLAQIHGVHVVVPQGAMYVMFGVNPSHFEDIADDVEFAKKLLSEENVFVFPGTAFSMPNYCRIVFCAPKAKLAEAFSRMEDFCNRHAKKQ